MNTSRYEFRNFTPSTDEGSGDELARWFEAVSLGFHDRAPKESVTAMRARNVAADDKTMTAVYDSQAPKAAMNAPVGTFVGYDKKLNVGGGLLPAYLISAVTVRPTHRRRGLLRRMMSDGLAGAAASGTPIAALTASEGTIYRRFGFGCAVNKKSMTVTTTPAFAMLAPPAGTVEIIDPASLREIGPDVFERYHRVQTGSIGRQAAYADIITGAMGENGEPDPAVRAALHYDDAGTIDGYVSYKFSGWNETPGTIELIDLVAVTADAFRGLWEFLGSIDLVTQITVPGALGDDLLPASLVDARVVKVTGERDHLWLRILDVPAALEAREYGADGVLTLRIEDSLDYAAGTYRLEVSGGRGTVTKIDAGSAVGANSAHADSAADSGVDASMDVADLSAIYLGAVSPAVLADAGRIDVGSAGAASTLRAVFASTSTVWCTTEF